MTMIEQNMDLECFELSFPAILLFLLALLEVIKIVIYCRRLLRRVNITSPNQESVVCTGQLYRLFRLMLYHARLYIRALYSYIYIYVAIARAGHVPTLFSRFVNTQFQPLKMRNFRYPIILQVRIEHWFPYRHLTVFFKITFN